LDLLFVGLDCSLGAKENFFYFLADLDQKSKILGLCAEQDFNLCKIFVNFKFVENKFFFKKMSIFSKSLTIPKKSMRALLNEEPKLIKPVPTEPGLAIPVYEDHRRLLACNVLNIQGSLKGLEEKEKEWRQLIRSANDEIERQNEEKAYLAMLEDPDGVLQLIEDAKKARFCRESALAQVEQDLEELKAKMAQNLLIDVTAKPKHQVSHIQLPHTKLMEFDGNPMNWSAFWGCFETAVNSQPIADIEKLVYLLPLLKGEAKSLVQGFAITAENYSIIVDVLKDEYG
jgi:hypothetical protein